MKYIIFPILFTAALQVSGQRSDEFFLADPSIFTENGKYYLTGTGSGFGSNPGFPVFVSTDLKNWSPPAGRADSVWMILKKGSQVFGSTGFWAPQIFKVDSTYYLVYTANEQTAIAQSRSILGPYTQKKIGPIDDSEKNIDPFIFRDNDGKFYLYHVRFDKGNYIWVAEFDIQKGSIRKETLRKCFDQTEPWEATASYKSAPILEGPTVIRLENKYYLFYSANHFKSIDYSAGFAVADSPYGPWVKQKESPILHRTITGENGSGHGDLFKGPDGKLYYVYHVHFSQSQVSPRRTRIVPLNLEWDPHERIFKFSVDAKSIITPVLAVK